MKNKTWLFLFQMKFMSYRNNATTSKIFFLVLFCNAAEASNIYTVYSESFKYEIHLRRITWNQAYGKCRTPLNGHYIDSKEEILILRQSSTQIPLTYYWTGATSSEGRRLPQSIFRKKFEKEKFMCPALDMQQSGYVWKRCSDSYDTICKRMMDIAHSTSTDSAVTTTLPDPPTTSFSAISVMTTTTVPPASTKSTDPVQTSFTTKDQATTPQPLLCKMKEKCARYSMSLESRRFRGSHLESVKNVSRPTCAALCHSNDLCCAFEMQHGSRRCRLLVASTENDPSLNEPGTSIFKIQMWLSDSLHLHDSKLWIDDKGTSRSICKDLYSR